MSGSLVSLFSHFFFFFSLGSGLLQPASSAGDVDWETGLSLKSKSGWSSLWIYEAGLNIWDQRGQDESLFKK